MTEQQQVPTAADNAAWVSFNVPMKLDELRVFSKDVERLFRINPHLEFSKWEKLTDKHFHVQGRNTSQQPAIEFDYEITVDDSDDELQVAYSDSLKKSTTFKLEPSDVGAKMTIVDEYHSLSEEEAKQREAEVDRSLQIWGEYLVRYILTWTKWSWLSPWRWYMTKVWQPMKPMARRITYALIWITVFEIALIALGAGIYFAEYS
ncbi:MAG: hypothetical protein OEZ33_08130 [Gammaproteobacteria bacterium]|nr:hypothetical protein [Gammaproteobacteria bacterium]